MAQIHQGMFCLILCAMLAGPPAVKAGPDYNHFQVQLADGSDGIGDGLSVEGSHRFHQSGFVRGEFTAMDNLDRLAVGAGYLHIPSRGNRFELSLTWEDWSNGFDDNAMVIAGRWSSQLSESFGTRIGAGFYNFENRDNDLGVKAGGALALGADFALVGDIELFLEESFHIYRLGVRRSF